MNDVAPTDPRIVASLTDMAIGAGATTIQINPNPTGIDHSINFNIRRSAGAVLPQLVADTWNIPQFGGRESKGSSDK